MPRILGIDYGSRRLGLAVSDPGGTLALALRVADVRGEEEAVAAALDACREAGAERVVVGMPVTLAGGRSDMTRQVEAFVERLRREGPVPVDVWDERFSTAIAERALVDADVSRHRRRKVRDKLAAQIMLQSYLDHESFQVSGFGCQEPDT